MELKVVCGVFYCFFLPTFLLAACLFRFNALSLVYLLYLLLLPWFLWPNKRTLLGHTGRFIKAVFGTSLLFLLAHVTFQICLHTVPELDKDLSSNCSSWETLSRHIGVSRLPLDNPWSSVRLLVPDLGVFIISLVTLVMCDRLLKQSDSKPDQAEGSESSDEEEEEEQDDEEEDEEEEEEEGQSSHSEPEDDSSPAARAAMLAARLRATILWVLQELLRVLAIALLALAGITLPSAFSGVYYLLFIGVCTWWACHLPISHLGFNVFCVMVGFFTAGHLVCLYLYQSFYAQAFLPPDSLWARLFGLKGIVNLRNCSSSMTSSWTQNMIGPCMSTLVSCSYSTSP
ncbi:hypothetical protein AGOR_G00167920 [Albula goreensis]|uniref:Piezo TM1-24 domain-containing protein n=1 Tax=Albula goreensis TaxID=1534307 RepID=A0A8T3D2L5_9TELE|nr:hypothetical protein AGOR_G00167920 [Albula goreensis]